MLSYGAGSSLFILKCSADFQVSPPRKRWPLGFLPPSPSLILRDLRGPRKLCGKSLPPGSSGLESVLALFSRDQVFHARRNFVIFQQFTTIDLRDADFDLREEPFVVTDQDLDRFLRLPSIRRKVYMILRKEDGYVEGKAPAFQS